MVEALEHQEQDEATRELASSTVWHYLSIKQWNWRQNQALTRRVLAARLRGAACVENSTFVPARTERSVIRAFSPGVCLGSQHEHIFVLGPTGVGKSYVASATGAESLPGWLSGLLHAGRRRCSGICTWQGRCSLRQLLRRMNRIDVLVVDDWVMAPFGTGAARLLGRSPRIATQTRSMILTSQLPVSRWHNRSEIPHWPTEILDRLVAHAHRIEMRGDSHA